MTSSEKDFNAFKLSESCWPDHPTLLDNTGPVEENGDEPSVVVTTAKENSILERSLFTPGLNGSQRGYFISYVTVASLHLRQFLQEVH